jgi:lysophospholipase L1-like esterase
MHERVARTPPTLTPPPTVDRGVASGVASGGAFGRICGVALGMVAVIGATYAVPSLAAFRPWVPGGDYIPFWNVVGREWLGQGKALEAETARVNALRKEAGSHPAPSGPPRTANEHVTGTARAQPAANKPTTFPPYQPRLKKPPAHGIEAPEALDPYFRKLTLVDLGQPGAVARTGHWGDSVLGIDGITSGIRRRLQGRFGDAGHGFHLMDRYHPAYRQQGITFEPAVRWERCLIVWDCRKHERRYGYGGLLAYSAGGARSVWSTPEEGFGTSVSRFELWFAREERGGQLEILVDGTHTLPVETDGAPLEDDWFAVSVPPGPHRFQVTALGNGIVRAYGVVLENDGPGVVWDGMALVGGSTRGLRTQDPGHIARQVKKRNLDLVAFMFGGNDLERGYVDLKDSMQPYYDEYTDVLRRFRAGKPGLSCLVLSPVDHGRRLRNGEIASKAFVKSLVDAQREIARRNGCGFFDVYTATGGEGTAARWFRARPPLMSPDLGHPTEFGHDVVAGLVANAVIAAYEQYRARMQGEPLTELAPR